MQTFVWDQNFVTGLETVDKQHRHLVNLINRFGESLIKGSDADGNSLQALFHQLAKYAQYHFAEEERLMLEAGIAPQHLELHRDSHRGFVEQVSAMWNFRSSMPNPSEILHEFLISWLGFHILVQDQSMARQIALIRAGESTAKAYEIEAVPKDRSTAALVKALNNLYQILSEQNRELADANLRLEERVAERTRELGRANQALNDANRQLERSIRIDSLLGIANRKCFDERLDEEWRRANREQTPLALLMIDVDFFKRYNDTYGHQAGDICLQAVVQAAHSVLHRPGDLLARYGGEELVIVLPNTAAKSANAVALEICARLTELHILHSASTVADHVTVSIGVASMIPNTRTNSDQLVGAADRALYSAKQRGRNQVCVE
jgi:diguanylate cyclase (GGDEF)-like protein/hemerythrin-like metal-binding protein